MNCHPSNWLRLLPPDFDPMDNLYFQDYLPEDTAWRIFDFKKYGSNVFFLSENVYEFGRKPLSEILVETIYLPFESFYIYFGDSIELHSPENGVKIEGAYIHRDRHHLRGIDEGSITVALVPSMELFECEEKSTYSHTFEFFSNSRGFISEGEFSTFQEHLDRLFENRYTRMGKFNYEITRQLSGLNISRPFEDVEKEWKPDEKDVKWKEVALEGIEYAVNAACYLHMRGRNFIEVSVHYEQEPVEN